MFGVVGGEMILNPLGDTVWWQWYESEEHRPEIYLDGSVVMPNHGHGNVVITTQTTRIQRTGSLQTPKVNVQKHPLGAFVRAFKSSAIKKTHATQPYLEVWQGRYHDQIIRSKPRLSNVHQHIQNNPAHWDSDEENR